jgi:hypothetical protein
MPELAECVCGIDPGSSGGIAWCSGGKMQAQKLDGLTEHDVRGLLFGLVEQHDSVLAYLEVVGPSRSQDPARRVQGVSSTFTFGRNYGFLRGVLVGIGIPFEDVRPAAWQRIVGIPAVKEWTPAEKKREHKAKAQQFWPHLKVTLNTCDALLIAEYGLRQHLIPQKFAQSAATLLEGA